MFKPMFKPGAGSNVQTNVQTMFQPMFKPCSGHAFKCKRLAEAAPDWLHSEGAQTHRGKKAGIAGKPRHRRLALALAGELEVGLICYNFREANLEVCPGLSGILNSSKCLYDVKHADAGRVLRGLTNLPQAFAECRQGSHEVRDVTHWRAAFPEQGIKNYWQ
jgi:hypothetical protein